MPAPETRNAPSGAHAEFAARVTRWQAAHGRHDLPWQGAGAYPVWLSEIMLQQTQVATVLPYYARFMARFPNLRALAQAPLDEVLALWSGLGYYARARNLHRAARDIMARHGGRFPHGFDAVAALPGIGRSTAGAICVFAHGARYPILDGNVKRVLARCFGIEGWPGDKAVQDRLWAVAESVLPEKNIEGYTQGLMDLGALVCLRRAPLCGACPLKAQCTAFRQGLTAALPTPRPRKAQPRRRIRMLVLTHGGRVLLEKRAEQGIWGGLWSLPEAQAAQGTEDTRDIAALCRRYGAPAARPQPLAPVAHVFTHFRLDIAPWRCEVRNAVRREGHAWMPLAEALRSGLPAPVRRILAGLA